MPDEQPLSRTIALAGNPNVGKSTVFNALTGMHQHTGNWPGKTVARADGSCTHHRHLYRITDLPGTYSLLSRSEEEAIARDFILFDGADCVVVVCDACCLDRGLNLVLQTAQLTEHIVVCVNLMDEAKKKGIRIDLNRLEEKLGFPVVATCARDKRGLARLMDAVEALPEYRQKKQCLHVRFPKLIEDAAARVAPIVEREAGTGVNARFLALKLLEGDPDLMDSLARRLGLRMEGELGDAVAAARKFLEDRFIPAERLRDELAETTVRTAAAISEACVTTPADSDRRDRKIDRVATGKYTGMLLMLLLLGAVFFITVVGANYPSGWLMDAFNALGSALRAGLTSIHTPDWLLRPLMDGVYLTLTWVIAVMLPPMAGFNKSLVGQAFQSFCPCNPNLKSTQIYSIYL